MSWNAATDRPKGKWFGTGHTVHHFSSDPVPKSRAGKTKPNIRLQGRSGGKQRGKKLKRKKKRGGTKNGHKTVQDHQPHYLEGTRAYQNRLEEGKALQALTPQSRLIAATGQFFDGLTHPDCGGHTNPVPVRYQSADTTDDIL